MGFKESVEGTPNLEGKWCAGLGALRAEDKPHIKPEDTRTDRLRGSVDVDSALVKKEPQAHRWDFAIGFKHANRCDEFIYWVELHTGSDSQISVVLDKFAWLRGWLKGDGKVLAQFDRLFVWVPSGPTSFTKGSTQVKALAAQGLWYTGSAFKIPINHPESKVAKPASSPEKVNGGKGRKKR
jgi:hypothetical protein